MLFVVYVNNFNTINGLKLVWKELVKTNKEFFETYERKHTKKRVNVGGRDKQDDPEDHL